MFVRPALRLRCRQAFSTGGFRIDLLPGASIERLAGDETLFPDGLSRNQPFLCLITGPRNHLVFALSAA